MVKNLVNKSQFAALAGVTAAAITKATKRGSLRPAMYGAKIDMSHAAARKYLDARNGQDVTNGVDPLYDTCVEFCRASGHWSASALERGVEGVGRKKSLQVFGMIKAAGIIPAKGTPPPMATVAPERIATVKAKPSGRKAVRITKKQDESLIFGDDLWSQIPEDIRKLGQKSLRALVNIFGTDVRFVDWLKALKEIESIHAIRIKNAKEEGELVSQVLIHKNIIDPIDTAHNRMLTDGAKTMAKRLEVRYKNGATVAEGEKLIRDELAKLMAPMKKRIADTLKSITL